MRRIHPPYLSRLRNLWRGTCLLRPAAAQSTPAKCEHAKLILGFGTWLMQSDKSGRDHHDYGAAQLNASVLLLVSVCSMAFPTCHPHIWKSFIDPPCPVSTKSTIASFPHRSRIVAAKTLCTVEASAKVRRPWRRTYEPSILLIACDSGIVTPQLHLQMETVTSGDSTS